MSFLTFLLNKLDRQKERSQDTVDELDQEKSPTDLPTSLHKMHLAPHQQRQQQDETLLDFIDHLIEKILGSEE